MPSEPIAPLVLRERVSRVLKSTDGRVPRAAELLGIGTSTLYTWLRECPELRDLPRAKRGKPSKRNVIAAL